MLGKFLDGASSGDIYYNGGNIGIGTTSPTHVFHTVGSEYSDSVNSLSTSVTYAKLRFQTGPEVNGSSLSKFQGTTGTGATTRWYNQISNGAGTTSYDMLINPFGGNVGIGTTNPLTKLQISDSGNSTLKIVSTNATSPGIELIRTIVNQSSHHDSSVFADDAWTDWKIYNNNSKLEFQGGYRTASSGNHLSTSPQTLVTAMTLMNTGNVGIGATDPKAKLHVKGGHLLVTEGEKSKDETGGCIQFHSVENGYDTDMWGQDYAHSLIADVKYGSGGYDDKTEMLFFKGNNKDGSYGPDRFHFVGAADFRITLGSPGDATGKHGHEAARQHSSWANGEEATFIVKANGNVGIGETSPDTKLEIKSLNSGTVFTGNLKAIHYNQSEWITMGYGGISTGTTHSLRFGVNNSEKMRIDNDGNVGIGTPSPERTLHLYGNRTDIVFERSGDEKHYIRKDGDYLRFRRHDDATVLFEIKNNTNGNNECSFPNGNVGIGTTSPACKLEINGNSELLRIKGTSSSWISFYKGTTYQGFIGPGSSANDDIYLSAWYGNIILQQNVGNVGIGTTSPYMPLDVATSRQVPDADIDQYWDRGVDDGAFFYTEGQSFGSSYQTDSMQARIGDLNNEQDYMNARPVNLKPISAHFYDHVYISNGGLLVSSDERIKQNITEISDDISLKMLRDISCCSYYYVDDIGRQKAPTLGFIAQQVNKVFSQAVTLTERIIPNVMKRINNFNWVSDNSNNTHKLISDLQDVSGVLYRFYVSNNVDEREKRVEYIGNSDNTFTFENKWEHIFCYGYEVQDFHTLDKQKLYALNFSATQEIDRQQQQDKQEISELKTKNTELENKVATLESELAAIKQHLGI